MTSVGDISTIVEEDPSPEISEPSEEPDVPPFLADRNEARVSTFATGEIGRLNSVLGASISDLELALNILPDSIAASPESKGRRAVEDALDGCRTLAEFQRILARIDSMRTASRYEQGVSGCLDEAASRVDIRGVTIVRNYSTSDSEPKYDRQRLTQACQWLIQAMGIAILDSTASSRQRIISIGFETRRRPLITIGQTVLSYDEMTRLIERNLKAHWSLEAAKIALAWEGFSVGAVESSEFAGFRASRIDVQSEIELSDYLS